MSREFGMERCRNLMPEAYGIKLPESKIVITKNNTVSIPGQGLVKK